MPKRKSVAQIEDELNTASVLEYLTNVPDPRKERTRLHSLKDILVLSLCAIICGADGFVAIEKFGILKEEWLRTFLDFPNGIPSHDTIGRVFALLSPKALEATFRAWMRAVAVITKGEVVAIDGKTLRRSFRKAGSGVFVHMVSAWATRNRVVLGQVKTEEKSNEITAIPELLGLLYLKGCIVTIDAMGCQKDIAAKIVAEGADYCLTVKDNQPTLREDLVATFDAARTDPVVLKTMNYAETSEKGHGRVEVRRCWTTTVLDGVSQADQWTKLRSLALTQGTSWGVSSERCWGNILYTLDAGVPGSGGTGGPAGEAIRLRATGASRRGRATTLHRDILGRTTRAVSWSSRATTAGSVRERSTFWHDPIGEQLSSAGGAKPATS